MAIESAPGGNHAAELLPQTSLGDMPPDPTGLREQLSPALICFYTTARLAKAIYKCAHLPTTTQQEIAKYEADSLIDDDEGADAAEKAAALKSLVAFCARSPLVEQAPNSPELQQHLQRDETYSGARWNVMRALQKDGPHPQHMLRAAEWAVYFLRIVGHPEAQLREAEENARQRNYIEDIIFGEKQNRENESNVF